ncbi:MAG: FAD-linked oxidase C-terminal domain-containing protein [Elusimicrobiales bacterium]|nr:FAD-linked oxidase C-terminal domain-containing protein [Elusimicrobiales bacterium]
MFRKDRLGGTLEELKRIAGEDNVFTGEADILAYSYDAGSARARPDAVVRVDAAEKVAPLVRLLHGAGVPFLPRLAGTNLSGGTIPLKGGVILNLSPLNKIRSIDTAAGVAVVEPGVVNLKLQEELARAGFFYPPDPASQRVCTIGGNIGENAGGPLCLKYGVTADNVLGLTVVTPQGETLEISTQDAGPDLPGLFIGSEGTLGIAIYARLKILPLPKHIMTAVCSFPSVDDAMKAVAATIAAGIVPRALEAMDRVSLDAAGGGGLKLSDRTEAVLIIELDGNSRRDLDREMAEIRSFAAAAGSLDFREAADNAAREALWAARKGAYPALARLAPNVMVEDGAVPRPRLPQAAAEVRRILADYKLTAGLLFHAGDGNLHPNVIYDERDLEETRRVRKAGHEILRACIDLGGTISGEHGVGVEKRLAMNWLYDRAELDLFSRVKEALDPKDLANPDKIVPVSDRHARRKDAAPAARSSALSALVSELKYRAAHGIKSRVKGLGTRLSSPEGEAAGRDLDVSGLRSVLEIYDDNLTATFEAGIPLRTLRSELKSGGLEAPMPKLDGTLGGLIATKAWPGIRDLLLGLELALPDGTVCRLGGKSVKNVAGYDLTRLLCGSLGAYGVILSATIRLCPAGKAPRFHHTEPRAAGFVPSDVHRRLKRAFDPDNLLNPWIYG